MPKTDVITLVLLSTDANAFCELQIMFMRNTVETFAIDTTYMKILVVHRQKLVVDHVRSVLISNDPIVIHTESGLDGLLTSRIETFDLIICGTDLPVITGFELVRSIRTNSVNKNVPVIFIADNLDAKAEHLAGALGVAGMIGIRDVDAQLAGLVNGNMRNDSLHA